MLRQLVYGVLQLLLDASGLLEFHFGFAVTSVRANIGSVRVGDGRPSVL